MHAEQIRALIVCRLETAAESCNSYHRNHVLGQIRGLIGVLADGACPPVFEYEYTEILRAAGIPFTEVSGGFEFDSAWLKAHGFELDAAEQIKRKPFPSW